MTGAMTIQPLRPVLLPSPFGVNADERHASGPADVPRRTMYRTFGVEIPKVVALRDFFPTLVLYRKMPQGGKLCRELYLLGFLLWYVTMFLPDGFNYCFSSES
jgi:hypothetical protein